MNTFTVSFFGHRLIEYNADLEAQLEKAVKKLLQEYEYVELLIGRDGDFDILASSVIKRCIKKYSYGNTSFVLVLPYMRADLKNNADSYYQYYDEIEICKESESTNFKSAITIRNRKMVERSDLVICYSIKKSGGVVNVVKYAEKLGVKILNLGKC